MENPRLHEDRQPRTPGLLRLMRDGVYGSPPPACRGDISFITFPLEAPDKCQRAGRGRDEDGTRTGRPRLWVLSGNLDSQTCLKWREALTLPLGIADPWAGGSWVGFPSLLPQLPPPSLRPRLLLLSPTDRPTDPLGSFSPIAFLVLLCSRSTPSLPGVFSRARAPAPPGSTSAASAKLPRTDPRQEGRRNLPGIKEDKSKAETVPVRSGLCPGHLRPSVRKQGNQRSFIKS